MASEQFSGGTTVVHQRRLGPTLRLGPLTEAPEDTLRRRRAGRAVLAGILAVQALLTLRLENTAFQDEALYLYAGRIMGEHLFQGRGIEAYDFASYFSGSPYLYPVLGGYADALGGLGAARALSLCFLLGTTALLYSFTRRLFGIRAALCAAGAFAVTMPAQLLGALATFDAPALFGLALLAWLAVVSRTRPRLLAAAVPVAALTVAVKYAAALYLPTICVLALLVADASWWRSFMRSAAFAVASAVAMLGLLAALGAFDALARTTTERAHGDATAGLLLAESARWGGLWLLAGLAGAALCVQARPEHALTGLRGNALSATLCLTALLAPAYQIHLRELVSLNKHVGYGLLFVCPLAGVAVARLAGPGFKYALVAIAAGTGLLFAGMHQADRQYRDWPDSTLLLSVLWREVPVDGGHNLTEAAEVPVYYLRDRTRPEQWTSMYYFRYAGREGLGAYLAALRDGYFDVIVLDGRSNRGVSAPVEARLREDGRYRLVARIPFRTTTKEGAYRVWSRLSSS